MTTQAQRWNKLAQESSPYLKQHAQNPVDWYPWGDEALKRAREGDKPILLSVGYSACHWCHVMAHESFENQQTAELMNQNFVNVKLDREERPDLDQLYQGVVQLMGRGGGWPLTVFLTPDLKPFFGGTYFPPEDRFGIPGFPRLLTALAETWKTKRGEILSQAESFTEGLDHLAKYALSSEPREIEVDDIIKAGSRLEEQIDGQYGGFGSAPKFPNPMNLALLLRGYRRARRSDLLSAVTLTLRRMATGGIYDQLGGGFHRYSVDQRWLVPHFEKMLYDNAQLIHLYAEAFQIQKNPLWSRVVQETVDYVHREMTSPSGAFFSAQDADSEGEEGKFFVWTVEQIDSLLREPLRDLVKIHFGISEVGNFEHRQTVLEIKNDVEELARRTDQTSDRVRDALAEAKAILFEARAKRVRPGLDDKILAGWNGLMIRGLSFASRVFDKPDWTAHAARAADTILTHLWDGKRLARSLQGGKAKIDGFVEDYGNMAAGLAALYQATFNPRYIIAAQQIADRAVELFWEPSQQVYRVAPVGQTDLICATYALHDNAYPSGASTLTEAQVTLSALTGDVKYLEQAGKYIHRLRDEAVLNPFAYGHLLLAADSWLDGGAEVSLVGEPKLLAPFENAINETFAPTVSIAEERSDVRGTPLELVIANRRRVDGGPTAYFCQRFTCEPPITDAVELKRRLERFDR